MTYRRAFKVGDRVRFGEHEGTVATVNLLSTHIRSLKNEEIVIPNATIINGEIVMRDRQLVPMDEEWILNLAQEWGSALRQRSLQSDLFPKGG